MTCSEHVHGSKCNVMWLSLFLLLHASEFLNLPKMLQEDHRAATITTNSNSPTRSISSFPMFLFHWRAANLDLKPILHKPSLACETKPRQMNPRLLWTSPLWTALRLLTFGLSINANGWLNYVDLHPCVLQRAGFQAHRVKRAASCQPRCVLNLSCFVICPCGRCRQCQARVFLKWQQLLAALFSAFKLLSAKTHFALNGQAYNTSTSVSLICPSHLQLDTSLKPSPHKTRVLCREREMGKERDSLFQAESACRINVENWHRDSELSSLVARKISCTNLTKHEKLHTPYVYNACDREKGCKNLKKKTRTLCTRFPTIRTSAEISCPAPSTHGKPYEKP